MKKIDLPQEDKTKAATLYNSHLEKTTAAEGGSPYKQTSHTIT